jgi:hypothetical protein
MRNTTVECPHQRPRETKVNSFICDIGLFGGFPYLGNCLACVAAGQNNAAFVIASKEQYERSHPPGQAAVSGCCDSALNPPPTNPT